VAGPFVAIGVEGKWKSKGFSRCKRGRKMGQREFLLPPCGTAIRRKSGPATAVGPYRVFRSLPLMGFSRSKLHPMHGRWVLYKSRSQTEGNPPLQRTVEFVGNGQSRLHAVQGGGKDGIPEKK